MLDLKWKANMKMYCHKDGLQAVFSTLHIITPNTSVSISTTFEAHNLEGP